MANPWTRLQNLLPRDVVQIGTSQGSNGDGTTDVVLIGGGRITATGEGYGSGQKVFVKGGQIISEAPSLTTVEIDV